MGNLHLQQVCSEAGSRSPATCWRCPPAALSGAWRDKAGYPYGVVIGLDCVQVEETSLTEECDTPRSLLGLAVLIRPAHVLLGVVAASEVKDGAVERHQPAVHEAGEVTFTGEGIAKDEYTL